jgi:hypothetical protein
MKFLPKNPKSDILKENLTYQQNRAENNRNLLVRLLAEQQNFCAYSEKYIEDLDSVEVEHFDASKKYADDYYNYYAVLRKINAQKRDEAFRGNSFFKTLFFQNQTELDKRIRYIKEDGVFETINIADTEAQDLIEFLGMNDDKLYRQRKNHLHRLHDIKNDAKYDTAQFQEYLKKHLKELSFITALEHEFNLHLQDFL